jgi:hypothetical protein
MWKLGLRPRKFPEKEYINRIFVAVYRLRKRMSHSAGASGTEVVSAAGAGAGGLAAGLSYR